MYTDNQKAHRKPTYSNILEGVRWLNANCKAGDHLFFYYSGHGGSVNDHTGDELDKKDETLVPLDHRKAGQITDDLLRATLIKPLKAGVKLTAIFDSCHSGTVLDLPYVYHPKVAKNNRVTFKTVYDNKLAGSPADVLMISGCRDSQYSYETQMGGAMGGAMTAAYLYAYTICMRWKKKKRNKVNIRYSQIFTHIARQIHKQRLPQTPQFSTDSTFDLNTVFTIM
jgi:hypothetical protein